MNRPTQGVIAAGSTATAEAGARALALGGNAVDAVCAASLTAFVAEGLLCSPAGGGAAVIVDRDHGARALDFFAVVPGLGRAGAIPADFHVVDVDFGPTVQQFHVGRGAAAVPGALVGITELHARAGRLPLAELVAPATEAARQGFAVGGPMAYVTTILAPILDVTPAVQAMFRPGARDPVAGQRLDNPALGDFLELLAREGVAAARRAFDAELLARFGPSAGGAITSEDLARYEAVWRRPVQADLGDGDVFVTNPPPSSGGALVAMGLRAADRARMAADGFVGPAHLCETARLLRALDRVRRQGYDEQIGDAQAAAPWLGLDGVEAVRAQLAVGRNDLGSTTHISVMTEDGEVASLTMSNGEGCGHALEPLGIHVNNFLGEDDINPGGFHLLPAGTRMTTMMAPSAVRGPDGPRLTLGSGGSSRIRSAILQALLGVVVHGRPIREAIDAPRLHVEGDRLWYEGRDLDDATTEALLQLPWSQATCFDAPNLYFGGVHAVARDPDGRIHGAGDARRGGAVASSPTSRSS